MPPCTDLRVRVLRRSPCVAARPSRPLASRRRPSPSHLQRHGKQLHFELHSQTKEVRPIKINLKIMPSPSILSSLPLLFPSDAHGRRGPHVSSSAAAAAAAVTSADQARSNKRGQATKHERTSERW